jgi:hypothetical protein
MKFKFQNFQNKILRKNCQILFYTWVHSSRVAKKYRKDFFFHFLKRNFISFLYSQIWLNPPNHRRSSLWGGGGGGRGGGGGGLRRHSASASKQNQPPRALLSKVKRSEARELKSEEVISRARPRPTCYAAGFCQSFLSCQGIQFLYKRVC